MNKAKLKTYAPQARKDFIAAVTQRANLLGLSESAGKFEALPAERRGDVVLIAGREWPARVAQQRDRLVRRIRRDGFGYTMEAVAYTWFNRFAALRYMELHDYLGHGHRVLSSATAGGLPDILAHAADLATSRELPGLIYAHAGNVGFDPTRYQTFPADADGIALLTGKMQARIEMLEKDATAAPSTAARNKLNKQIEKLRKKHVELLAYDEKLRHYADMRIRLDLDDGVKVNYGKFGDLLAEVKAVTGGKED